MSHHHRRALALSVAVLAGGATSHAKAQAAQPQCASLDITVRDACQKGMDLLTSLAPQLQGAIAGGNALVGSHAPLGRIGRITVALRGTVTDGRLGRMRDPIVSRTGVTASTIATTRIAIPVPSIDLALALFPGIRAAGFRWGSVDALGTVMGTLNGEEVIHGLRVGDQGPHFGVGGGARIGIQGEMAARPALTLSVQTREVPRTRLAFATNPSPVTGSGTTDSVAFSRVSLQTRSVRLAGGVQLGRVSLGAGVGRDRNRSAAELHATINSTRGSASFLQTLDRDVGYASAAVGLWKVRLAMEGGVIREGSPIQTVNTFTGLRLNEHRPFVSAGIRFDL
jgi:hypothetical protein